MVTSEEIEKLSELARIKVSDSEVERLRKDIESILDYVSVVSGITVGDGDTEISEHRNIMREDGEPHETGMYTEKIVAQLPKKEGDFLVVKKIIEQ